MLFPDWKKLRTTQHVLNDRPHHFYNSETESQNKWKFSLRQIGFARVPDTTAAWTEQHRAWCIAVICWSGRPISVSPVLPSGHPQYSRVFTPAVVGYIELLGYTVCRAVWHPTLCGRQRVNLWRRQDNSLNCRTSSGQQSGGIPTVDRRARNMSSVVSNSLIVCISCFSSDFVRNDFQCDNQRKHLAVMLPQLLIFSLVKLRVHVDFLPPKITLMFWTHVFTDNFSGRIHFCRQPISNILVFSIILWLARQSKIFVRTT